MPTSIFNKITDGFSLKGASPVTSGIEDVIYIFNEDDITLTYDPDNALIVTGLTAVSGAKIHKFEGTNNSFNAMSKLAKTQVGPRYTEEIDFNIAGLSVEIKTQLRAMGYGRVKAVVVNNYKGDDSSIELFGAVNSLILTEAERNAADENLEGGYKLKLTNPDKLREPYPPRAVFIKAGADAATYASTLAAIEALTA
jgi:hypothetical protein